MTVVDARRAGCHRLARALRSDRRGLICYLPLGDPSLPPSRAEIYVDEGVDVLELGFPADRPYRDGETVARSMARARAAGAGLGAAFEQTRALRERFAAQAMVWMVYPGAVPPQSLPELAAAAGVDGVLYPEHARRFPRVARRLADHGVDFPHCLLWGAGERDIAATSDSTGYVMVQSRPGVTGVSEAPLPDTAALIERVRTAGASAPIALGIGISDPEQVHAALAMGADAVIVGSAVVEASLGGPAALRTLLRSLRRALDDG